MDNPSDDCLLQSESRQYSLQDSLKKLYSLFTYKNRVLIVIDPDPDAIGSALALKRLLLHKVRSVTIGMIRPIRRLNNLALVRLLKLPLTLLADSQSVSGHYEKYLLVDGQPSHNQFFRALPFSVVIDHHPINEPVKIPFSDIRDEYGSTSTIMVEYLRAAGVKPSRSLATALLYGIKTDTRNFERHTLIADIDAFQYLYPLVNHNALRKIEVSDLALQDLRFFHLAVERRHVVKDWIFAHVDAVSSADILVEIAEFFLKIHGISWSVISGDYEGALIIVIRNDGCRKDAGKAVREAFGVIGSAGGHRSMARAEVPMEKIREILGTTDSLEIERLIRKRFSPFI